MKENVGTKKRGRPPKNGIAMTAQERKQKFMEKQEPAFDAVQKEKERNKERYYLFHIKRNHIAGHAIPESIDQENKTFRRLQKEYLKECKKAVEVVS